MKTLVVVSELADWPGHCAGLELVSAATYLADQRASASARVINLCRSTAYQSAGYYVSLLAQARGHAPLPEARAIEDAHSVSLASQLMEQLADAAQAALTHIDATSCELAIYFGRERDGRLPALSRQIFSLLPVPLLRVRFERRQDAPENWCLAQLHQLGLHEVPPADKALIQQMAATYALRQGSPSGHRVKRKRERHKPAVAILFDPDCKEAPSNPNAIDKFQQAAQSLGMAAEVITPHDCDRLGDFDALFIRDTTSINHYTYQLSRQAAADGMIVMDDPDSILKCTNKVYLAELFERHRLPTPKTVIVHHGNLDRVIPTLGLPCILKLPDGAFSSGVVKITSEQQLHAVADGFLRQSALLIAQEYLPTTFDWRIGVLDNEPLFACKYFMAPGHWQIIKRQQDGKTCEGQTSAVPLAQVPANVLQTALSAARLIGDGFYGVDMKQIGQRCYIIEVNDNPNVDMGNEDGVMHDALYRQVMQVFRQRIQAPAWSIRQ